MEKAVFSTLFYKGQKDKPIISRKHCSIEYKDDRFYLRDEGSLNGTYYNSKNNSCKVTPQKIEDGGIIIMGEEHFSIKFDYQKNTIQADSDRKEEQNLQSIKCYKCNNCGKEYTDQIDYCDECLTYGSVRERFK